LIEVGPAAATISVGAVTILVAVWGAWISLGSSRHGPVWALSQLERWQPATAAVLVLGALAAVAVDPFWMGAAVAYVGVVAWWLTRTVRRHLLRARSLYGEMTALDGAGVNSRLSIFVMGGATVLGVVAIWDVTRRGWVGSFGIALALVLGWVGFRLRAG
jgi:hypothetical protein